MSSMRGSPEAFKVMARDERSAVLQFELMRRYAKRDQSRRGFYDANGVRQGGLIAFIRYFWTVLEPEQKFVDGWPLWAMCEHLEAVSYGEITRLLINVPPGFMKSLMTDVFWPAWEWGPLKRPHLRYVAFSYSASLTERDNDRFRMLVSSDLYQRMYGPIKAKQRKVQDKELGGYTTTEGVGLRNRTVTKVMNDKSGWKLASSVGGVGTGERGDRIIIDDPHNVIEAESEVVRTETVRWFRESISSRFNNLDTGALVLIMQRVHYDDVSGVALGPEFDYCQFIVPWAFDPYRWVREDGETFTNAIGWSDPRLDMEDLDGCDGVPAWPERFDEDSIARLRSEAGPYAWASQYQQSPVARGMAIFKREYWKLWESVDGKFPAFDYLIGSLDGAFTEKEENDPSALTIWGVWGGQKASVIDIGGGLSERILTPDRKIMLVHAWRKHLQFSGPRIEMKQDESRQGYKQRTSEHWGLIEWVQYTCVRFKVDRLLIEAKANGISAAQELRNRYGLQGFGIQLVPVKGDKVARALTVQPTFSQGLVYAPDRDWAEQVIEEAEMFPKGKRDDLTDSMTQALSYLRGAGMAQTQDEVIFEVKERGTHKQRKARLYPV